MPNQYSKVQLTVEFIMPQDTSHLKRQYTKSLFELLKNKIPQNALFVDELIRKVREKLD